MQVWDTGNFVVCSFENRDGTVRIKSCEELNRSTVLAWMDGAPESVEEGKRRRTGCFLRVFLLPGDGGTNRSQSVPAIVKRHGC